MNKYELWLKSCSGEDNELNLLEEHKDIRFFQLVRYNRTGNHYENNYNFRQISYHIWNVVTGEWLVLADYRLAFLKYESMKENAKEKIYDLIKD